VASVALGACVIEKHFTLKRADGGVDSAFSLEPAEFEQLRIESERAWQALGTVSFGTSAAEAGSVQFRRSLYIVKPVRAGGVLSADNVRAIRPGFGLAPKFLDQVLGMRLRVDAAAGTPVSWELLRG
jgi:N-acetylneuraminate synthase